MTIAGRLSGTATWEHKSGEQNVPLGIADIEARAANITVASPNFNLIGKTMDEDEQLAELFFKGSSFVDYKINGTIISTPS